MKIYYSQQEVEKDIKNNLLEIEGDVKFECSISINASIKVSGNIDAYNINAWDINANDIDACNVDARDIDANDINAGNIDANDINAKNIDAYNINAYNINACNISYYAFCISYNSIKCSTIKAKRDKHSEPICLDGKLEIKKADQEVETIKIGDQTYNKQEVEKALKDIKAL